MDPEEEPVVQVPQPEEPDGQSGADRTGAYTRQGLPSCLVTRVGDVYIKASQTSIVTVIAEVLCARSAEIDACAPTPGLVDSAQVRNKALWIALPRDATDRVFKKLYAEWLVGEGALWVEQWWYTFGKDATNTAIETMMNAQCQTACMSKHGGQHWYKGGHLCKSV